MKCWGDNYFGELGDGTTTDRLTPVDVSGLTSGVAAVSAGGFFGGGHTCALTTAGGVKCWGYNYYGQLGDGQACNDFYCSTPVNVTGLTSGVTAVSVGLFHTCAVTTAGGLKCWGANSVGELGDGTNTGPELCNGNNPCSTTPVDVSGLTSGVAAVSAGHFDTCAVTTAGGAKCWGNYQTTPGDVDGLTSGVAAVSARTGQHTCALTTVGGLKCWGDDRYGQLGDGSTATDPSTPVDVSGLTSGVASVSAGDSHTCAVTTAASVRCWGSNDYGQLGDGTNITRTAPWWPWDVDGDGVVRTSDILGVVRHYHQDGP